MADQEYLRAENRFWIDLHKCKTIEATEILNMRIDECYKYGIANLEIIYGTPDDYEGSIQQAIDRIIKTNPNVETSIKIHAGVIVKIKDNPNP